jgi:YbbR domain-containing protein
VGDGFIVSADHPNSVRVSLRGDEEEILGILDEDVLAVADLTPFGEEGSFRVPVVVRKKGTALRPEAMEIRVQPREVNLSQERRTVRSLVVEPDISGFPALGFELTQYFVSPTSVTAVGPRSQMADLTEVLTETIDLSGRRNDFTVSSRLVSPSDQVVFPGGGVVEFRGVVDEAVVIRTIADMEIVVLDLDPDLKIVDPLPPASLTVQGNQLTVEGARPQEMTFYIDASGVRAPGIFTLPVEMDIPAGLAVLQFFPRDVNVRVLPIDNESTEGGS